MKKKYLLILTLFLVGCNSNETPTDNPSTSNDSSSLIDEGKVVNFNSIDIGLSEKYHITSMFKEEYKTTVIDYIIEDREVLAIDAYDNIIGKKIGSSDLTILIDEEALQTIRVNVIDDKEAFLKMHFDLGNLYNKNIIIFGDSISDNTVTAYEANKPKFWVEMLEDYGVGDIYNHAKSGATVGYSVSMAQVGALSIVATNVVNEKQTKNDLKKSDYAFILIGTNDYWRQVTKGEAGDVNDSNYQTTESFVGSYTYLINKIYENNPHIKIICLSTTASTWDLSVGDSAYSNRDKCIQTRPLMNKEIKKIAAANNCMYIDLYDLWSDNVVGYCPDGIHPQTRGYEMIIDAIMNHNK